MSVWAEWKRYSDKVVIKNIMIIQMENSELMDELQKELNLKHRKKIITVYWH